MNQALTFKALKVNQPIGEFFITSMGSKDLQKIAYADMCRLSGTKKLDIEGMRDVTVDDYTGWQRKLNSTRVDDIKQFVRQPDACFPTGIILSVDSRCAQWDEEKSELCLSEYVDNEDSRNSIGMGQIARILDGQHRLAGLEGFEETFELNVSIFVGLDIAEQAYIFSTVNLAQTKVNKSLVYELFDSAKKRSPQKLCHQIAVALDSIETSPFYKRIKRLGCATPNRKNETITQAAFVQALMPYLTENENLDRELYARGKDIELGDSPKTCFRFLMKNQKDLELTQILYNYFMAVRDRWPKSWGSEEQGQMLNKTNGFRALMRLLPLIYADLRIKVGEVPSPEFFLKTITNLPFQDGSFTVDVYKPGSTGESDLLKALKMEYEKIRNTK